MPHNRNYTGILGEREIRRQAGIVERFLLYSPSETAENFERASMNTKPRKVSLKVLFDLSVEDRLKDFRGGFAVLSIGGVVNSGGIISCVEKIEGAGQGGVRIKFQVFIHTQTSDGQISMLKHGGEEPYKLEYLGKLEIYQFGNSLVVKHDSETVVLYPNTQKLLDKMKLWLETEPAPEI